MFLRVCVLLATILVTILVVETVFSPDLVGALVTSVALLAYGLWMVGLFWRIRRGLPL